MKTIKHLLIAVVVLLCSATASAYDVSYYHNGKRIYLNITDKINKTVEVTNSSGNDKYYGHVEIPSSCEVWIDGSYKTYSVTGIGERAFDSCKDLYSISIPNTIASIGSYAFSGCTKLKEIHITDLSTWCNIDFNRLANPLYEGAYLMVNGEIIRDLIIPEGVKEIKTLAFHGYKGLSSVHIPNSVTTIGKEAFQSCSGLYSISIPESVEKIDEAAFALCENLTSIIVEPGNNIYDSRDNCNAIIETATNTLITGCGRTIIPNTITSIAPYAFAGARSWVGEYFQGAYVTGSIKIPDSVTIIGEGAFYQCSELESVSIGKNVKTIDQVAFSGTGVELVFISDLSAWCMIDFKTNSSHPFNSNSGGGALYLDGNIIRDLEIPDNITLIKQYAFYNCSGFTSVRIPDKVDYIDKYAFAGCSRLNKITFPRSITSIGDGAFSDCSKLEQIICKKGIPPTISYNTFKNVPTSTILDVPAGTKNAYTNADGWKYFSNIKETVYYYTIEYVIDGETIAIDSVACGSKISLIEAPVKEGYTFSGWSEAPAIMPAEDVVIEGSFTLNSYAVTYLIDGEEFAVDSVAYGSEVILRDEPTKEGHTFSGWSEVPETMPAKDIIVEGSFSVNSYLLTYKIDGATYATDSITYGATITPIAEPTKEGYTFSGWSEIPETMPAEDIIVEGSFSVNSYTVTFMIDGDVYETATVEFGAEIELPTPAEKPGYIFSGWLDVPTTMPAKDIVIEGKFEIDTTGINTVTLDLEKNEVYNLKGQRITESKNLTRGIYIVNGKKTLVK